MVSVINNIDTGHEEIIHDAQMDFYGTRLATCSSDKSIRIFEIKGSDQTLIAHLTDHKGPVWQLAWAHPKYGNLLASCSYDNSVIVWQEDGANWRNIYQYNKHTSSVNSVCWAPHEFGLVLACASMDGSISLHTYTAANMWEVTRKENAHSLGVNAVSWAPSYMTEGGGKNQHLVSGGCDTRVKVWGVDPQTGEMSEEVELNRHSDSVKDVAWAPSIGLPRSVIASCSQDRRVTIWVKECVSGEWHPKDLGTFDEMLWHVSWSVTGDILAVSGENKVTLWKEDLNGHWVCLNDSSNQSDSSSAKNN